MRKSLLLVVVALVATACPSDTKVATPTTSMSSTAPTNSAAPSPTPTQSEVATPITHRPTKAILYVTGGKETYKAARHDLWYYDALTDTRKRLTSDKEATIEQQPRFVDDDTAAVVRCKATCSIATTSISAPGPLEGIYVSDRIHSFDPPSGGSGRYAVLENGDGDGDLQVSLVAGDDVETIRTIPSPAYGREGIEDDDILIEWSVDGENILVVYTPHNNNEVTMWVIDPETGADVVAPRFGTFARWAADASAVYYRAFLNRKKWFRLDLESGTRTDLAMTKGFRPDVSSDGSMIVYDSGDVFPKVKVYDVEAGTEDVVVTGYVHARWLDEGVIIGSVTESCEDAPECIPGLYDSAWWFTGSTGKFFDPPASEEPAKAHATGAWADVLYA